MGKYTQTIGNYQYDGELDDLAIYNRALTSTEVFRLYDSGRSLHDTAFLNRLSGTSDVVRDLDVSETGIYSVATADGATQFDQYGNRTHTFSIDNSSDLNTSVLTNNINNIEYLDGKTVLGYNVTGGIETITRLTDLTGLETYLDWTANDTAHPDTLIIDDGAHTVSTWSNDPSVDYLWSAPNSNGTTYDYKVVAIDTDAETSSAVTASETITLPINTYEIACNT